MRRHIIVFCLLFLPLMAANAKNISKAPDPPASKSQTVTLQYKAYWGGVYAGDLRWYFQIKQNRYESNFNMQTKGLLDSFYRLHSDGQSRGTLIKNTPQVGNYTMTNITRKKQRQNGWSVDTKNKAVIVNLNPADDNRVPKTMLQNTVDPLAAILQLRQTIKLSRAQNMLDPLHDLILPVYDGRRRFDVMVTAVRESVETISKKPTKTIVIDINIKPLAGIKNEDLDAWNNTKISLFFSDDGFYIPVKVDAKTPSAAAVIVLGGGCIGAPVCSGLSGL